MKLAALFVNKSRQAAIAQDLAPFGIELASAPSIANLLQRLKRPDAIEAVLLEDDPTQTPDWLAMLQMRMTSDVPVVVVGSPRGRGMAEALRNGATDFVDYDGSFEQLLARLQARVSVQRDHLRQGMEIGPFALCAASSAVMCNGAEVNLTAREFALAWVLFSSAGRVVSVASLAARVWGRSNDVCKRTLEQHIYKLRRKLTSDPQTAHQLRIQAIYGIGYRLDVVAERVATSLDERVHADLGFAAPLHGTVQLAVGH